MGNKNKEWINEIKSDVQKNIEEYHRGKYELTNDEINTTMPKVVEFYNDHPKDKDVFRDTNGCVLLIQTPKAIFNDKNELVNKLEPFDSLYGGEQQFMLKDCKFRHYGQTKSITLFAEQETWLEIDNVYDQKAFVKVNDVTLKYKKLGETSKDIKPMKLAKFLQYYKLKDLSEIPNEYITYYGANIQQVIK